MTLSIKSDKVDQLARQLVALTGESITEAVEHSLEDRLQRERWQRTARSLDDIVDRYQQLPVRDDRTPDEILGYDDRGLPT